MRDKKTRETEIEKPRSHLAKPESQRLRDTERHKQPERPKH